MKQIKDVLSTKESIPEIEVNVDTVYVRTNTKRTTVEGYNFWQYDEVQYTYKEWLQLLSDKNKALEESQKLQDKNIDNSQIEINATQEMVDFIIGQTMSNPVSKAKTMNLMKVTDRKTTDNMSLYILSRIKKKAEISVKEGKKTYTFFLSNPLFADLKIQVDTMLKAEDRSDLIAEL